MRTLTSLETISRLVDGRLEDPRRLLGPHVVEVDGRRAMSVRAFLPETAQAWIEAGHEAPRPMRKIHPSGLFEAICPLDDQAATPAPYHLQVVDDKGTRKTMHDPYAFSPLLSEFDLYLLGEGTHWQSYEKLGAQIRTVDGVRGVNFAVWAPNATSVSIVGDFNKWDERRHPMRKHIPSGVWELFIPGLADGTLYKYRVKNGGFVQEKCDPYGFGAECPPKTASKVIDLTKYQWQDADWMAKREKHNGLDAPMSYYEVHLGSWKRPGDNSSRWMTYREVAVELVKYVKEMGYTHIELMPVAEHPFSGSWGYQIVGYFAPTARYGSPEDFMFFVDLCHQNDIGVVLDWVPAHFPKDGHGLAYFDGTNLYEHSDPRKGEHRDWGTLIFNYGRHEVRNFLISNALFWFDKYHIDGLRVDAVASMIYLDYSREAGDWEPNCFGGRENLEALDFLRELNVQSHTQFPGTVTIAEESTAWPNVSRPTYIGGLGFSLKWNMGWMNDTRSYMKHESIHRKYHHDELTFSLIYAFTENFVLPLSHDEVVHGKGSLLDQVPGDLWQKFANMRLLYGYMWTHPGKKLTFMGGEFGQWTEWNYDTSLQWHLLQYESHQGLQRYVADLNKLLQHEPALHELDFDPHGFEWVDCHNWEESVLAFLRKGKNPDDFLLAACNFTPVPRQRHRIGVSKLGFYREVLNSDSSYYGGSNCGNGVGVRAETIPWHGRPYSIEVVLPPLGVLVFKPE